MESVVCSKCCVQSSSESSFCKSIESFCELWWSTILTNRFVLRHLSRPRSSCVIVVAVLVMQAEENLLNDHSFFLSFSRSDGCSVAFSVSVCSFLRDSAVCISPSSFVVERTNVTISSLLQRNCWSVNHHCAELARCCVVRFASVSLVRCLRNAFRESAEFS